MTPARIRNRWSTTSTLDQAERVARAFTVLFHLVNLAEERHRVRVLRSRDRTDLAPARDSLAGAVPR